MNTEEFAYVAADPTQPGAAWGIVFDDPKHPKDVAKTVAGFIKDGANVMRVDVETGRAMIMKWKRPEKKAKVTADTGLFGD